MSLDTNDVKMHALLYFTIAVWGAGMFAGFEMIDHVFYHWDSYGHRHLETNPTSVHFAKIVGKETVVQLGLGWRIFWAAAIGGILMPGATFLAGALLIQEWLPAKQRQRLWKKTERESRLREAKEEDLSHRERELALVAAEANVYEHINEDAELRPETAEFLKRAAKQDAVVKTTTSNPWNYGQGEE